jgi:hypothetical protein
MATVGLWPDVAARHYQESFHLPLTEWLDSTPKGGKKALIVARECRKTMMMHVAQAVRRIVNDPNIRIMAMTRYLDTAEKMCGLVKDQFQKNQNFRRLFPEFAINEAKFGKVDEFTHPLRTAMGLLDPTYYATYLGAPLISRRCDILIMDDIVDEDDFKTPEGAVTAMDKFTETIPLVESSSDYNIRFFLGTPKSFNDPAAAICGKAATSGETQTASTGYEVRRIPALIDANGDADLNGEPTFPLVHNKKALNDTLELCRLNPKKGEGYFFREYLVEVQAPSERKFDPDWLDRAWVPRLPSNIVRSGIALDSATKDEQILFQGDFTVLLVGHFDAYGHLYLTDAARSNGWKSTDLKRELVGMSQRGKGINNVLKEKVGEGGPFGQIREWFEVARLPLSTYPLVVRGKGKKMVRIVEMLQPPFQAGHIHFVEGFPRDVFQVIKDELVHLGMWSHDDAADALSLFFHPDFRIRTHTASPAPWKPLWQMKPTQGAPGSASWGSSHQANVNAWKGLLDETGAISRPEDLARGREMTHILNRSLKDALESN